MGYTTDFSGGFTLTPSATPEQVDYINNFAETRHVRRDANKLKELFDGKHSLDGDYGTDGEFFTGGEFFADGPGDVAVINVALITGMFNTPPATQPGLWCQWVLTDEGGILEWDGNEKFYEYEKAGVKEYCMIDYERKQAEFYHLGKNGIYQVAQPDENQIYHSRVLKKLELNVKWLWQKKLPGLVEVLKQWNLV